MGTRTFQRTEVPYPPHPMDLATTHALPATTPEADQRRQLWTQNFTWLVRLRWVAVLSQAVTVVVVRYLGMELDGTRLYALVGLALSSNIACALWLKRGPDIRE